MRVWRSGARSFRLDSWLRRLIVDERQVCNTLRGRTLASGRKQFKFIYTHNQLMLSILCG